MDLIGKRFGRLVVVSLYSIDKYSTKKYVCRCDCGNTKIIGRSALTTGETKSCKCLSKELLLKRSITHGLSKTRLYRLYWSIKDRCYDQNHKYYKYYGGRGIVMCDQWLNSFKAFYDWAIANGYDDKLQIDRFPDNDGNYEPENCRWTTSVLNNRNRRSTRLNKMRVGVVMFLFRKGITQKRISQLYQVHPMTINNIISGKTWSK